MNFQSSAKINIVRLVVHVKCRGDKMYRVFARDGSGNGGHLKEVRENAAMIAEVIINDRKHHKQFER
jgi:hypothetical protein